MAAALTTSILLLDGDAEARLLVDAEAAMQAVFADREVRVERAWSTRPDWLDESAPEAPASLVRIGALPGTSVRALLEQPHKLVIISLLPAVSLPALHHRDGGAFLALRALRASWSEEVAARVDAECTQTPPMSPGDAAMAWEPLIERLQARGTAVALCTAFRHVKEPLEPRGSDGPPALREVIRQMNLEVARLSQRTGCFVLDVDRLLAHEGGATLDADCFGGDGRAAEIALDEFAAVVMDAMPDELMPMEIS
jgi:hypothetical protein